MLARRDIVAITAILPLIAVVFLLWDDTVPSVASKVIPASDTMTDPSADPSANPTNRAAASLGITDIRALERFNAKRDAKAFAHSYNIAVRLGVKHLANISSPHEALAMLVRGVQGEGEIVHSFRSLNPFEITAASSLVIYQDGKMVPSSEAEFTELEKELKKRALSCKFGSCTDCVADVRTNRLKRARENTVALSL